MRKPLILALSGALLFVGALPASARYECSMTGVRMQPACCCAPSSAPGVTAGTVGGDTRNGAADPSGSDCCEVTYEDERPAAVTAQPASGPGQKKPLAADDRPPLALATVPIPPRSVGVSSIRGPDGGSPPPEPERRHLLFCSFLC